MNEWPKLVVIAFELLFTSVVIALIALLAQLGQSAGAREQDRIDSIAIMEEYREYNKWDNQNRVYYQDIVELMLLHQNSVRFQVNRLSGAPRYYSTATPYTEYTRDKLQLEFYEPTVQYYEATLIRDPADPDLILGYSFEAF